MQSCSPSRILWAVCLEISKSRLIFYEHIHTRKGQEFSLALYVVVMRKGDSYGHELRECLSEKCSYDGDTG